jgi:hypothetical protein
MVEAVFAGAVLAIALRLISRSANDPNGLVCYSSRGSYMRDLNNRMKADSVENDGPAQHNVDPA